MENKKNNLEQVANALLKKANCRLDGSPRGSGPSLQQMRFERRAIIHTPMGGMTTRYKRR